MRVLLGFPNQSDITMRTVPLGLGCVATAVRHSGHQVRLLDLMEVLDFAQALAQAVGQFDPEVIGVSLRNIDDRNMLCPHEFLQEANEVIAEVKRHSRAPVVLGGAGYSMFPEAVLQNSRADMGIQDPG